MYAKSAPGKKILLFFAMRFTMWPVGNVLQMPFVFFFGHDYENRHATILVGKMPPSFSQFFAVGKDSN
jgi:hypothetical protein